jgi:hypothetical protein
MSSWRRLLVLLAFVACRSPPITPDDVAHLKPGQRIRVHVWAPGGPGPGNTISGTYQGQDDAKIFIDDGTKRIEIFKGEIHDDTRNLR